MHIFSSAESIELLDGIAVALIAAAATLRARSLGSQIAGAAVIGCICGPSGAVIREIILHGQTGARLAITALPADAVVGALGAICALFMLRGRRFLLFGWVDSLAMGLACALGTVLGLPELGFAGATAMGLANGLLPTIIRDVSLGDVAMVADKKWYAAAAIICCVVASVVCFAGALGSGSGFMADRLGEWGVCAGVISAMGIRLLGKEEVVD